MNTLKKYILIGGAIMLAACSKEIAVENPDDAVTFSASPSSTKTAYSDEGAKVSVSWVEGDCIGIWSGSGTSTLKSNSQYRAVSSGASSGFEFVSRSERIRWEEERQSFYAIYPYNAEAGSNPRMARLEIPSLQRQTSADDISNLRNQDIMWACAPDLTRGENDEVKLDFHHALAILDLELSTDKRMIVDRIVFECISSETAPLSFENGSIDLSTGTITAGSKTSASITLECGFAVSWPATTHFYIAFNPSLASETMRISAVVGGQKRTLAERTLPASGAGAGKVLNVKVDYEVPESDAIQIKDLSEVSTANTYLVTSPGEYYRFKANVKGNGQIPQALQSVVEGTDITPGSVLVLWYNCLQTSNKWVDLCPIVMGSLVLQNGYVYFDTPSEFINGNVVIAAFAEEGLDYNSISVDAEGNIDNATLLWSWNIWAVEGLDLEAEALNLEYTAANGQKTPFTVMNRNLGAIFSGDQLPASDTKGYYAAAALGNLYQWGRKDPIPHIADYENYWPTGNVNKLLTTPTYTPIVALQKTPSTSETLDRQMFVQKGGKIATEGNPAVDECLFSFDKNTVSFSQAINEAAKYPYKYFKCAGSHTYDKHWFPNKPATDPWKYLRGDCDTDDGTALEKTLFDPCPPGWKLWQEETINAFVQNGAESASIAPGGHGLMVAGSYFGYNAGGRNEDMGESYSEPVVICGYACPIGLISGTGADRYNHQILRYTLWKSPTSSANSSISVTVSNPNGGDAKKAGSYSVRCIKE